MKGIRRNIILATTDPIHADAPQNNAPAQHTTFLKTSTPTWRSRCVYLVPSCPIQTAVVHHRIIRQYSNNTSTNAHTPSEFLVTDNAMSLVCNSDVAVATALPTLHIIPEVQPCRNRYTLSLPKTSNNPRLVYQAIS